MKKTLKINMPKLSVGGMEKALVDLLNKGDLLKNYEVTLLLAYNVKNNYLNLLPKEVKIDLVYKGKWNIIGKILTSFLMVIKLFKCLFFKYDVSICYSHHHGILSKITRLESKNNIVFVHTDLLKSRTEKQLKQLNRKLKFSKFLKVVCVSECAKKSFNELFPSFNGKVVVANNYIDGEDIIKRGNEKIQETKDEKLITFINVARHDESHKKISRIINASKQLNDEGYKFKVLLIGNGKDTDYYKNMIKEMKIKNIELLGEKLNPFPYYKISDAFVFSSSFEGYGIVLNEARVMGIPIIATDVADVSILTKEGYGILCDNNDSGIYEGMKEFLKNGYTIKNKFDYKKFNEKITKTINEIVKE